ncbi:MAG: aldo/keto reductase [Chloroflexota bacterium]
MINIGLGTASFGTRYTKEASFAVLNSYKSLGGRVIDTANNYAFWAENGVGGESEAVIGEWLATQSRIEFRLNTKIGARPTDRSDSSKFDGLSAAEVYSAVHESLERLQVDAVDVLYAHVDDANTPLAETWDAFSQLVSDGFVQRVGISNYRLDRVQELVAIIEQMGLAPISYAQYRHSVIQPIKGADFGVQIVLTDALEETLKQANASVVIEAYSPLLDGAFEEGGTLPTNYASAENETVVLSIRAEAAELEVSPSALVLWKLSEAGYTPLTMSGHVDRIESNLAMFVR